MHVNLRTAKSSAFFFFFNEKQTAEIQYRVFRKSIHKSHTRVPGAKFASLCRLATCTVYTLLVLVYDIGFEHVLLNVGDSPYLGTYYLLMGPYVC